MDQASPAAARRGLWLVAFYLGATGVFLALLLSKWLPATRLLTHGTPLVRLEVAVLDEEGKRVSPAASRLADAGAKPEQGDVPKWQRPTPKPGTTVQTASIELRRAPIALSVDVLRGEELFAWLEKNEAVAEFVQSKLVRGFLQDLLRALRVRGQDLEMTGVEGAFLDALLRDVIVSGASLHYDLSRGRRGFVLTFDRNRSALASRLLPIAVQTLARRELQVERAELSVIELLVGEHALYLAETEGIVHVGSSLGAVLNLIEIGPLAAPAGGGTLAVTARAEAWLKNLLPVATGKPRWSAVWSVDLSKSAKFAKPASPGVLSPGVIRTSGAKLFAHLAPELAEGVLAAMPRDVFAAAAASIPFPKTMTPEDWNRLATQGPSGAKPGEASGGFGVVWDLRKASESLTEVGLIVRRPEGGETPPLDDYVAEGMWTGTCAADTMWVAATSEPLVDRMLESCDRESLSVLDQREARAPGTKPPPLFLMLNPAAGLSELVESGIATATEKRTESSWNVPAASPEWKKTYLAAVDRSRSDAKTTLGRLPVFLFEGKATIDGATLHGTAEWPKAEKDGRVR